MRILHTADWHLGRIFYGRHLTDDQAYVLEKQFFQLIKDQHIDAFVLAGDVFDRSVPPVEAVQLWDQVITKLAQDYKIPSFIISGNHDGPERLEMGHNLLASMGIYIGGSPQYALTPISIEDKFGPISFCLMPYSEPRLIYSALSKENEDVSSKIDYNLAYQAWGEYLESQVPKGQRSIAIAHAFVTGCEPGGSERPLTVGGAETIHTSIFKHFNYTALGHLHGSQQAGADYIRYSGSLLKYSFDEAHQDKSFSIIDMDASGNIDYSTVPIETKRDVVVIEGFFDDLMVNVDLHKAYAGDYVLIRLLDTIPIIDGMARLRTVFPYALGMELTGRMATNESLESLKNYKNLNERELFAQFAQAVWNEPLSEEEHEYINHLWDSIAKEEF